MTNAPALALLHAAQGGDRAAFDQLFGEHLPKLRGVLRQMVGNPDDVDDLAQQSLLKAYEGLGNFRGESSAGTWLCSIGARLAIDHLRSKKRWRTRAQVIYAASCLESEAQAKEVGAVLTDPTFSYAVNEHIAYCFTCVGRTLEPEAQAALVLRDVLELTNQEAATALGMNHAALRHRLSEARQTMQDTYAGLCALVNKEGVCWQCSGLREVAPEDRRGPKVPEHITWPVRLRIVRDAPLDAGCAHRLHDVFFRQTEEQETEGRGDPTMASTCGRPPPASS